ncbi:MAG: VOC family protein, partial [Gaiellaceae bacterium]
MQVELPVLTQEVHAPVIDVQRVDYIRVPVTDMEQANHFYGDLLGLERNPNSPGEDWVEYEAGNLTLA